MQQIVKVDNEDVVKQWLASVSLKRSGSKETKVGYEKALRLFSNFLNKTPTEIIQEWEQARRTGNFIDRDNFSRDYENFVEKFQIDLYNKGYTKGSIAFFVSAIQSFFHYYRIPIEFKPPRPEVKFHNRDLSTEELAEILNVASIREKAAFTMLAQSGLRPFTLCQLKYSSIKDDFEKGNIPCKIEVPKELAKGRYREYFTFMGKESVEYLKQYFKTRKKLITDDSYIFMNYSETKPLNKFFLSRAFKECVDKLQLVGKRQFKKPAELRLYNLRKFFRNHASKAGYEFVQYWMGHILKNQDEHYLSKYDIEAHKDRYCLVMDDLSIVKSNEKVKVLSTEVDVLKNELEQSYKTISELQSVISTLANNPTISALLGTDKDKIIKKLEELEHGRGNKKGN